MAETIRDLEHARELAKALAAWLESEQQRHMKHCNCFMCDAAIFSAQTSKYLNAHDGGRP